MYAHRLLRQLLGYLLLLALSFPAFSQSQRSILTRTCSVDQLAQWLADPQPWTPYPKPGDAWTQLPEKVKAAQIALAEENLGTDIPQITASLLLEFSRNGNRSHHGDIYFGRRNRLARAVIAESIEQKGRFMDEISDLVWAICEESFWVIPAHYGEYATRGLPDLNSEYVDLFAAETGALLAWTHYLLADQLSPVLDERIRYEVDTRILKPNLENELFWWMGAGPRKNLNNWTPWVCSNWLACVLLMEQNPAKKAAATYKIMTVLDRFLDPYPADGGCDEGPGYWGRAGASLFDCLDLLEMGTNGKINVWDHPLVKNIGQYIYKVHIQDDYYVNFADAAALTRPSAVQVFLYGKKIQDEQMMAFGAWLAQREQLTDGNIKVNMARTLATFQALPEIAKTTPEEPFVSHSWFPDLQVLVSRANDAAGKGFFLAAKGGHNQESHNHNDVGNFLLYHNGKPFVIDIGVETYTKKTFSKDRYDIWTMQSAYHNLPTINGVMQAAGKEFAAKKISHADSPKETTFSLDIADAYPDEAGVEQWQRTFTYNKKRGELQLTDDWQLKEAGLPIVMSFMTAVKPRVDEATHTIWLESPTKGAGTVAFTYPAQLQPTFEEIAIEDARLKSSWGDWLYRVQLTEKPTKNKGSYRFTFSRHPQAPIAQASTENLPKLQNPISESYLQTHLRKTGPHLVLTPEIEASLKQKIKTDPLVKNYYAALQLNATQILAEPLLTRNVIGRRLLSTSREMLYRMTTLGMVYRMEKDPAILKRINEEVLAVCNFSDWNPSHYLDVAEMSLAVAFAVDWVGESLPKATKDIALVALIEKGIKPSYNESGNVGWINGGNNWNQVCNGGMIAASIVIADTDRALAAKTISRSLDGMPRALKQYMPDGVYPEGSTYWGYGTGFSVVTSAMLQSAFGTDFGLAAYPGLMESADFRLLTEAPSGWYYNFADCGDKRGGEGDIILAWFATQTGNALYLDKERFLQPAASMGKLSRIAGAGLVWLSQFEPRKETELPLAWKGEGENPVVFFRGGNADPGQFYFGGKGGKGTVSHGNMDAGSFILELDGVRWSIDPGNQNYHELEKTGFNLWGSCQDCERWTLLTKNNYGHSTLTINDRMHYAKGFAPLLDFQNGSQPEATFDLSAVFGGDSGTMTRRFVKESNRSLLIEDQIQLHDSIRQITWQMMTTADVEIVKGGAILRQDGKELKLDNLSHPDLTISLVSLDPAPLELDRQIKGLKRIEIRIPAYAVKADIGNIRVRLSGK